MGWLRLEPILPSLNAKTTDLFPMLFGQNLEFMFSNQGDFRLRYGNWLQLKNQP